MSMNFQFELIQDKVEFFEATNIKLWRKKLMIRSRLIKPFF